MKEKIYDTLYEEQETNINISYSESKLIIYTCRKNTYKKLLSKLGEPNKKYFIKNMISGGTWEIPFNEKKKLTSILSRPLLIGSIK